MDVNYHAGKSVNFDKNFGRKFLEGNFAEKFGKKEEKRKFRVMEKEIIFLGVETLYLIRVVEKFILVI